MSKARNISNLFSASTDVSTDAEVTAAIASHAALADPHTGYVLESGGSTITVSSGTTVPLTIQNNGTGLSFLVNDEATDSTPFSISATGNVGIGTSSPDRQLKVSGSSVSFGISDTSTGGAEIAINPPQNSSGFAQIDVTGANALRFNTNGSERMRIASNGVITTGSGIQAAGTIVGGNNTGGTVYNSMDTGSFSVRSPGSDAGQSASISFHRPGLYAVNMGLDTDNQFKIGGWSAGSTDHFVLNFGTGLSVSAARANTAQSIADGRFRNIYTSTSNPSGGNDGDLWAVYV